MYFYYCYFIMYCIEKWIDKLQKVDRDHRIYTRNAILA